jgi:hypothetical protein
MLDTAELGRNRDRRGHGSDPGRGHVHRHADRAIVVRMAGQVTAIIRTWLTVCRGGDRGERCRRKILGVDMPEREDDLDEHGQQGKPRAAPSSRSPPDHSPHATRHCRWRPFADGPFGMMLRLFCDSRASARADARCAGSHPLGRTTRTRQRQATMSRRLANRDRPWRRRWMVLSQLSEERLEHLSSPKVGRADIFQAGCVPIQPVVRKRVPSRDGVRDGVDVGCFRIDIQRRRIVLHQRNDLRNVRRGPTGATVAASAGVIDEFSKRNVSVRVGVLAARVFSKTHPL